MVANQIDFKQNKSEYYVEDLYNAIFDGEKFPGSFGATKDFTFVDYWTLRRRSVQLFKENSYAKGAIRRLLANEIHTGLNLEANPISELVGLSEDDAIKWAEGSELNFNLWAKDRIQCDYYQEKTFGALQREARQTALISGDCLVILRANIKTGIPMIQLIDGANVQASLDVKVRQGNYIKNGIEYNSRDRIVAYWVQNITEQGIGDFSTPIIESKRVPAFGEKSGKKIAWLILGTDKLIDENRGEPILSAVLYMLKELDRYRDSEQRAATINAMIPLFIKKTVPGAGSRPMGAGATRRDSATVTDSSTGEKRSFNISNNLPGQVIDELTVGEEPVSFNTQRPNTGYKVFEDTIINAFAWCLELPPEILRLLFQSNFSASRQANNEFNVYLQYIFWKFGSDFCQPIYNEQLFASVLNGDIKTDKIIDAKRAGERKIVNAWTNAEWSGLSRPSVDILKDAKAAVETIGLRIATYNFWCRRITGMSFRNTTQKLARETKLLERAGLTSSIDENNNGEPLTAAAVVKKFTNIIKNIIDEKIDEIKEV